jgi:3-phosphoshikimate 1-carboxyvinyltransferase
MIAFRVQQRRRLGGAIRAPGDKSMSHRAAMFGAIAEGRTEVHNFLPGEDCLSTVACLEKLGVGLHCRRGVADDWELSVTGRGLDGLREPDTVLDVGNSGTTIRLLSGLLSGQPFHSTLTGDDSIRGRPMDRVAVPLRRMGARIDGRDGGKYAPLSIRGGGLRAIDFDSPVASAQVKSAVLLAGLYAEGETSVTEPFRSRDHTERMLRAMGARVAVDGTTVRIAPRPRLAARQFVIPGDISSAVFFLVAGLLCPDSDVLVENVGTNPTRAGVLEVLQRMGADLRIGGEREEAGEPVADIEARTSYLHGTEVSGEIIPRLIDEIPILAVAACFADGETRIRDAAELRVKETDRIAAVVRELRSMGAAVEEMPDGMVIRGVGWLRAARVKSHNDHRVAMALAIAGLAAEGETVIDGFSCVATSFPDFERHLRALGGDTGTR